MIRRIRIPLLCLCLAVLLSSLAVSAENYVRFNDGRYLKVDKVVVHQEAIELDLGNQSRMFLPFGQVDWFHNNGVRQLLPKAVSQTSTLAAAQERSAVAELSEEIPTPMQYTTPEHNYGVYLAAQADRLRRGRDLSSSSQ